MACKLEEGKKEREEENDNECLTVTKGGEGGQRAPSPSQMKGNGMGLPHDGAPHSWPFIESAKVRYAHNHFVTSCTILTNPFFVCVCACVRGSHSLADQSSPHSSLIKTGRDAAGKAPTIPE